MQIPKFNSVAEFEAYLRTRMGMSPAQAAKVTELARFYLDKEAA